MLYLLLNLVSTGDS